MELLPDEIIMNIFSRISTLDFLRLRCVCKSWGKMIIDMESLFLQREFSPSKPVNNQVLIMDDDDDDDNLCVVDLAIKARDSGRKLTALKSPIGSGFKIIGSCDGILCLLSFDQQKILVTNPFKNQKILLPELNLGSTNRILAYGFGYDAATKSYKVVVVVQHPIPRWTKVFVCDGGSTNWRRTKPPYLGNTVVEGYSKAFLNGRLHWLTRFQKIAIMSFDLKDEKFRWIELRRYAINRSLYGYIVGYDLIVFRGCLCVVICYNCLGNVWLQIWEMKEYGVEKSWTVDHNFMLPNLEVELGGTTTVEVLGEVENDKILLKCGHQILLLIDLKSQNFKYLQHAKFLRNTTIHSITFNLILS